MNILVDTGPLVALLNVRDAHHAWCTRQAAQLKPPLYTCEAVLAEAHFLLQGTGNGRDQLIRLLKTGHIEIQPADIDRTGELMLAYADLPMSFADACLVGLAETTNGTIFTLDSDFRVYRKKRRARLPLICP